MSPRKAPDRPRPPSIDLSPAAGFAAHLSGPIWLLPEAAPRLGALSGRHTIDPAVVPILCRVVLPVPDWWTPAASSALAAWVESATSAGGLVGLAASSRIVFWGPAGPPPPGAAVRLDHDWARRPLHVDGRAAHAYPEGTIRPDDALLCLRRARLLSVEHHPPGTGRPDDRQFIRQFPPWVVVLGPAMLVRLAWCFRPVAMARPPAVVHLAGHLLAQLAGMYTRRTPGIDVAVDVAESMLAGIGPEDAPLRVPQSFGRSMGGSRARALARASATAALVA